MRGWLTGRVLVVAGEDAALAGVADAGDAAGALVAVVSCGLGEVSASVRFRTNASDASTWDRVLMHVEQHLGPVDGAATDAGCHDVVREVLMPDLDRRGHGDVVIATEGDDPEQTLTRMVGTRRATPPRPRHDDAGR